MKQSKSEFLFFILSLLLVLFLGAAFFIFRDTGNKSEKISHQATSQSSTTTSNSSSEDTTSIEQSLINLKAQPTQDGITSLQAEIDKVSDNTKKAQLQEELNVISANLAITTADSLRTKDSVANAQVAIDKVSDATAKANLQAELDPIKQAVSTATTTQTYTNTNTYNTYNQEESDSTDLTTDDDTE
ncbi:hypothetical protein [Streptococcus sciuri]|uniref:Peptidase n=1 Tax=Streptococcus sciuri TaxID=2973939 RepID=A0ABT2F835_9STRE|nr:hypothetical protein [Streptococcus sciuri]MCS4488631.1 hypothetical protein [Streptococcus sciuri]